MPGRRRKVSAERKTTGTPDERIEKLRIQTLNYLEAELRIALATTGNSTEAIKIMKAISALKGKNEHTPTDQDGLRGAFTFVEADQE